MSNKQDSHVSNESKMLADIISIIIMTIGIEVILGILLTIKLIIEKLSQLIHRQINSKKRH